MDVFWNSHATKRFLERVIGYNITEEQIESVVRKQRVKTKKEFDKKYKTQKVECIEKINETFVTIQKAESKELIFIITMWESKKREELEWQKKIKN